MAIDWRRAAVVTVAAVFVFAVIGTRAARPLLVNPAAMSQAVFARDGSLLRLSLSDDDYYRLWTPLAEIPVALVDATLLQEDRFFFWHPGVNPVALVRAFHRTYLAGDRRAGASTLTMQLARIRFDLHTRTLRGKLVQILRALELEFFFSKSEILEAYLNLAPYGGNVEGVGAASRVWFGKAVESIGPAEALTLAVIPKSPTARAPHTVSGREAIVAARTRLGERWCRTHERIASEAWSAVRLRNRAQIGFAAPHFSDRVLAEHPGIARLATTLEPRLQNIVERQVASAIGRGRPYGIRNAAVLLVDHATMKVVAYVGSAGHADASIDGAVDGVRARRSPGSALKPFVYALALDAGLIHPQSMLEDTSHTISSWNPENFDREFVGPISATDALVRSRNLPAVQLANHLPSPGLYGFLAKAGIEKMRAPDFYGLALALGGIEIRLDELVGLYALLANGGQHREPVLIRGDARVPQLDPLLSAEASRLVLEMLATNPRPGDDVAIGSLRPNASVAWKTGTSFGFRDAWAAGITGRFALGVWIGNFDGAPNPAFVGRDVAGPLFFSIVDALRAAGEPGGLPPPPNPIAVVTGEVCVLSGAVSTVFCPGRKQTSFIRGRSPIAACSIHREIAVDARTGLRACPNRIAGVRREVYEFWPSHLLALFRTAGIARRLPPAFEPACNAPDSAGLELRIELPQAHVTYAVHQGDELPLAAVSDADGRRVSWFVNDALVGQSEPGGVLFWPARPGRFVLRAVDELGRARTQNLDVTLLADSPAVR